LSTGAMVRLGKTYGNLMVDLKATNSKLRARTNRIVRSLTGLPAEQAAELLRRCGGELKTALVARLAGVGPEEGRGRLQAARGAGAPGTGGRRAGGGRAVSTGGGKPGREPVPGRGRRRHPHRRAAGVRRGFGALGRPGPGRGGPLQPAGGGRRARLRRARRGG